MYQQRFVEGFFADNAWGFKKGKTVEQLQFTYFFIFFYSIDPALIIFGFICGIKKKICYWCRCNFKFGAFYLLL